MKKRCVIVGGADINNYEYIKSELNDDDFLIFCDCGLRHMTPLEVRPSLIVGDFDSHENPHLDVETIVLPCEKDDTDTVFAVKEALKRGFDNFLLIGVIGARLDHTLGNVSILLYLDSLGKRARIIDDYSEMEIVSGAPAGTPNCDTQNACSKNSRKQNNIMSGAPAYISDKFSFFSLLNISGCAKGITIKNAKYTLNDGEITCEYQYGVSNEVLPGETAEVTVKEGRLLLIKDR